MKSIVVYSSVTGNTRAVADAILQSLPADTPIYSVHKAPPPDEYDFLALGFWVKKAKPDPRMLRYMAKVTGKTVAWFGTLAAWPDSPHAMRVRSNTDALLQKNTILGAFLCQGRLESRRFSEIMEGKGNAKHPLTEDRKVRLLEAARHPNHDDFTEATALFSLYHAQALHIFEGNKHAQTNNHHKC